MLINNKYSSGVGSHGLQVIKSNTHSLNPLWCSPLPPTQKDKMTTILRPLTADEYSWIPGNGRLYNQQRWGWRWIWVNYQEQF